MPGTPPPDARAALLTVAHELSNALAVAQGRLQLAERRGSADRDRLDQDIKAGAAAIRRAAVLLADLTRWIALPGGPLDGTAAATDPSSEQQTAIDTTRRSVGPGDALYGAPQAPGSRQQAGDGSSSP